ncbi:DUF1048 domain-containing protein [Umezawaea tangerina]|uniref:DNA-binding ferritin-like protein (Dps family) n=1 Tax=Umezawaea tangerina TaxID=84725 RepID=A0A2T0T7T1_9PSEU|nr:DUF1048 domain-containing protein [Umezawaea tangerina]PRY41726.1 DNA-binding ferritin-like protein (Dps family) [Umezawaea tangerina]
MNFWDTITGGDLTREWTAFEARAAALPADHRAAWEQVKIHLAAHSDLTGRNLPPVVDGVLGLLEETAAEGQGADEVLGEDVEGFCAAVMGGKGARTYRDRWREQLNRNVARKLGGLGG